jgi:hypothetical protein
MAVTVAFAGSLTLVNGSQVLDLSRVPLSFEATRRATSSPAYHEFRSLAAPKYSGEPIVRWNDNALTILAGLPPDRLTRDLAMVHLAAHDAVNLVRTEYETYAVDPQRTRHASGRVDPALAAAAAAHDVLVGLWPDEQESIDAMLQRDLDAAGATRRDKSLALGAAAAQAILTARADDGVDATVPYTFGPAGPGVYQPTPPFGEVVVGTQVPFMTPFVLRSVDRFRPDAPSPLASAEWAHDYNEVKAYGHIDSTVRTADQTDAARFFFELSTLQWNRTARHVAARHDKGLWITARAFALLNVSLIDAGIVTFDSKYRYNFWRPLTAIRAGDDGNASTDPDPAWAPLGATPPHPEHVAGHASTSAAAAVILTEVYGSNVRFKTTSSSSSPPGAVRSYASFDDMVVEICHSRIWAGIHFRQSIEAGLAQGTSVGRYVNARALRHYRAR